MKKVSRDIDPRFAQDLLERVPRACLSFLDAGGIQVQPVGFRWQNGRFLVCMTDGADRQPLSGQEAVVLIDEGIHYFELRAIYIRGTIRPAQPATESQAGNGWFELIPQKTVAWDYGTLHEVKDAH